DAIAQVVHEVVIDPVLVRGVDIDAIARVPDFIATHQRAAGVEQVNPVTPVLGAHAFIALNAVGLDGDILGAVDPDAETGALQLVVRDNRAGGFGIKEHSGIHVGQVPPPVTDTT